MASGFTFGAAAPQQQQQHPQTTSLFGTGTAPIGTATPSFGTPASTGATSLFGTAPAATTAASTGFGFSTPAVGQPQQQQPQTGFSLGGGLGAPATATSAPGTGFSFGGGSTAATVATAAPTVPTTIMTGTTTFGGLGGIPSTGGGPRLSSLALGGDPTTGWTTRNENRAVQEMPVPPEIIAAVEELKNHMKNQKTILGDLNRASDLDIDSVAEHIEEVRMGVCSLLNMMHKQELQSASIVKEIQELSKDIDLLSQARDVPAYGYGGGNLLISFLYELVDRYGKRMMSYKAEIERAEVSLQTIVGSMNVNAKDLWDSLTATKDTVVFLAAQIQELHEELWNEMNIHKSVSQLVYANAPKPWLTNALSGNISVQDVIPPLERAFATPYTAKRVSSASSLDSMVKRTYNMFNRVPSMMDSRLMPGSPSDAHLRTPVHDMRSPSNVGFSYSPSYHPSAMGSYMVPTTRSYPIPVSSDPRSDHRQLF